ncbi:MAG: T9SS type A sorting domain-containing protein [Bacteroidetes bacterium]|nr:T9SS type A sorting domain-containing protein [Bacteroidota bacterium]
MGGIYLALTMLSISESSDSGSLNLAPSGTNSQILPDSSGEPYPFAVGNKWYYRRTISQSTWGVETRTVSQINREIIDTTTDGTRIVQVLDLSDQTIGSEQWRYTADGTLYSSKWGEPVYHPVYAHDTVRLFRNEYPSMTTWVGHQTPHDLVYWSVSAALGIGIYNRSAGEHHSARRYDDIEQLVGVLLGGVVYGDTIVATSSIDRKLELPLRAGLYQNYPNPFNPSTTIRYGLPSRAFVSVTVINTIGQRIATLVQGGQDAGYHEVVFDAKRLPSGVYFYRLQAGSYVETRKMLLVR